MYVYEFVLFAKHVVTYVHIQYLFTFHGQMSKTPFLYEISNRYFVPLQVQSESETSSSDEIEPNSATEISTDSEFDNDELIRGAPKIFIDDTHLRKPTKVQVCMDNFLHEDIQFVTTFMFLDQINRYTAKRNAKAQ